MTRAWAAAAALACACGGQAGYALPGTEPMVPAVEPLLDLDPAAGTVEVSLVAGPATVEILDGKTTDVWAYRDGARDGGLGTVPGPMLVADAGDEVVVHFTNELPEATTIHWHGIRLDAAMDGTPASQRPVEPGGTFEYRFRVDDPGLYWFHPHVRADVQIERGLYAPLLVRGGVEPEVAAERVLVLDDVKIDAGGSLNEDTTQLDLMLGRQGNVLLVNGVRAGFSATARPNARERWRIVNVANGRFFNLAIPGRRFTVIGADGGLLAAPVQQDRVLLAPGERADVLVTLDGAEGDEIAVQTLHYDRGHDIPDPGPKDLFVVRLDGEPLPAPAALPSEWRTLEPMTIGEETPVVRLVLSETMEGADEPSFFINDERWPDVTMLEASLGDVAIWEIQNDAEMDHPFHLHGMFFQVLDRTPLAWKDTVVIPRESTVRFAVRYDAPGEWMYHCHILEHAELGMMGHLHVME